MFGIAPPAHIEADPGILAFADGGLVAAAGVLPQSVPAQMHRGTAEPASRDA